MIDMKRRVQRIVLPAVAIVMATMAPALAYHTVRPVAASATADGRRGQAVRAGRTGHWIDLTTMPGARSRPAVARGHDGNIYVFGGTADYREYATTFIYHWRGKVWSLGRNMPTAREGAQAVTLPDGRIAVLGGGTRCGTVLCDHGAVYDRVEVYDPSANTWARLMPMHSPRYQFAVVPFKGLIYAIGGSDGHRILPTVEAYNPATNTWQDTPGLPAPRLGPAAVADGNYLDIIGGAAANDPTLLRYDGHTWHTGAGLIQPTGGAGATVGRDGRVYVTGGYNNGWLTTAQVYHPRTDSWALIAPLPTPLCCMSMVTGADGLIYVVGGDTGTGRSAEIYAYRP